MHQIPTHTSGNALTGTACPDGFLRIEDSKERLIWLFDSKNPSALAKEIAEALEEARDQGFKQALMSVRAALGLTGRLLEKC